MGTAWINGVQSSKQLTVFKAPNVFAGWSTALSTALTRFNDLSTKLTLGVKFVMTSTAPDPNTTSGANVQFATANGAYAVQGMGAQVTGTLAGTANSGETRQVILNGQLAKAFVFVPARSQHHDFMKVCMAVHELIHAAGLHNSDHSSDADPDVFCSSLTPAGGGVQCGLFANRTMPPIWMTLRTAQKIQALWP
jgi:hypothetical protein